MISSVPNVVILLDRATNHVTSLAQTVWDTKVGREKSNGRKMDEKEMQRCFESAVELAKKGGEVSTVLANFLFYFYFILFFIFYFCFKVDSSCF